MIDYSTAQRPVFNVPTTTEWLRQKGLGRDGRPLASGKIHEREMAG